MRAVVVHAAGSDFAVVERPIHEPGPGAVRVRVQACGICHTDKFVKEGGFPGLSYPAASADHLIQVRRDHHGCSSRALKPVALADVALFAAGLSFTSSTSRLHTAA
jgi:threonine dehydrogenase-like Zn-dependent dehydrogenase